MRTETKLMGRGIVWCFVAAAAIACSGNKPQPAGDTGQAAQQQQQKQTVPTVVSVQCVITKSPSQLKVTANGEVPTGGWTGATLNRRTYVAAPADSIWEYDFVATPPSGMATQAITPITAEDTWPDYPASVVGVRVFGEVAGVKEVRLTQCTTQ
ncbi:MAG TPA: hypothetical protein VGQ52_04005 [Gemmatimonadaceae bacterium]|jgi:hypothetical protein|nr:hypothetical protein [Gemmatimonadaceae bacterium]